MHNKFSLRNLFVLVTIVFSFGILGFIFKSEIRCMYWALFRDTYCVSIPAVQEISFYSDSLKIIADIYPSSKDNAPLILLLHGSYTEGRKAALIQMMAKKFQEEGYCVFAYDSRGYGESDKPKALTVENFNFSGDVISAIDFLLNNSEKFNIDTSSIFIVGHSFGAGVALSAFEHEYRIKKMVLIGPPRRLEERFLAEDAVDKEFLLNKLQESMQLNFDLNYDLWREIFRKLDIAGKINILNTRKDIPLFLIDGEKEDIRDLEFMRKILSLFSHTVDYWTIPGTHHYLDVRFQNGELVYRGDVINLFIEQTSEWLSSH